MKHTNDINKKGHQSDDGNAKKESMTERIKKFLDEFLAGTCLLIGSNTDKVYIIWKDGEICRVDDVDSPDFKAKLRSLFEENVANTLYSDSLLNNAVSHIKHKALGRNIKKYVATRIAFENDVIYYNLADDYQSIIAVESDGYYSCYMDGLLNKKFAFHSTPSMECQKMPVESEAEPDLMELLKPYINLPENEQRLLVVTILTWFISDIPHPVIMLQGGQGSGKTTLTTIIQKIVDPCNHEAFVMPKNKEELIIALANNYLLVIDNASSLPKDANDLLCSAVTGASVVKRALYTNNDASVVSFKNCILLNGIDVGNIKPDLYDRTVKFEMQGLKGSYRLSSELLDEFEEKLPIIMDKIFKILSEAIAAYNSVKTSRVYRMADYVHWAQAISKAMFGSDEVLLKDYEDNRSELTDSVIEGNPVAVVLREYLRDQTEFPIQITPAQLLVELRRKANNGLDTFASAANASPYLSYAPNSPTWPKTPQSLSKMLNRLKENFAREGYEISVGKIKIDGKRYTKISKIEPLPENQPVDSE